MTAYEVELCFTGYVFYTVEAENEDEALAKAREQASLDSAELSNLEPWREADMVSRTS